MVSLQDNIPKDRFTTPARREDFEGNERRAGFELEFAAVDIQRCAELITDIFGGNLVRHHSMQIAIEDCEAGDFRIELDAQFAIKMAERLEGDPAIEGDFLASFSSPEFRKKLSQWIHKTAAEVVPLEIVTPPLALSELPKLEALREKLYEESAAGTGAGLLYGFGMHINPSAYSTDVSEVRDVIRAFVLLYPWLREVMQINISRRITSFIDPYPHRYASKITQPDYAPDIRTLIRDYVADNPTRNRALDLLPLFAWLEPEFLHQQPLAKNEKLSARPTFHYRLPNCELDVPEWRIARDWNYWLEVETLALDKEKLHRMMQEYQHYCEEHLFPLHTGWLNRLVEQYGY